MNRIRVFISLLLLSFYGNTVCSQSYTFAPLGAKWTYTHIESFFSPNQGYLELEAVADTNIQGNSCRKITVTQFATWGDTLRRNSEYLHQDGDSVWQYMPNDTFYLLYNFAATVGDTWFTAANVFGSINPLTFTVDSISNTWINGQSYREVFTHSNEPGFDFGGYAPFAGGRARIYEKFGGSWFMFPFLYGLLDNDIPMGLRCYEDSIVGQINFGIVNDCQEMILQAVENSAAGQVKVFPNPTNGFVQVDFPPGRWASRIILRDMEGRSLGEYNYPLHTSAARVLIPAAGLYLLEIVFTDGSRQVKKVVRTHQGLR